MLYAPGRYFACRPCGGLGYATQKEGAGNRASTRADKLRKRLGWPAGTLNGDGGKPKGMHWTTYQRLKSHHDALVQVSLHDIGCKLTCTNSLRRKSVSKNAVQCAVLWVRRNALTDSMTRVSSKGRFRETATERQPNGNQSDV